MFNRLGATVSRNWLLVILGWAALAGCLRVVAPRWEDVAHDGDLAYLPDRMPSIEGEQLLARAFPKNQAKSQIAILVERPEGKLTATDLAWADELAQRFEAQREDLHALDLWTHKTEVIGERLLSKPGAAGQCTVILLQLSNEFMASDNIRVLDRILATLDEARASTMPAGLQTGVSGSAAIGGDMLSSAAESIRNTERTTVALVVIILLLVYRAPLLVMIPLITIGISLVVSTSLLALLTELGRLDGFGWWNFKVFTTTRIFIVVILFGAGTDFCLFLISRYREELDRGLQNIEAITRAVGKVGEALVGSALTTICGLGMMFFADFGKFRSSGPAIALCLVVTLFACLTLAPALLRATGTLVFWPFGLRSRGAEAFHSDAGPAGRAVFGRFWEWASQAIIRWPGAILAVSVLALAPLAYAGRSVEITYDFLNELEPSRPSVRGAELARRHFPAGEMAPVTVLALRKAAEFDTPEGEQQIARLTKSLYDVKGVERVRSIAEPLGDPPGYFQPFRSAGLKKLAARRHKITKSNYLTQTPDLLGDVARLDIVLGYEPFSLEAVDVLNRLTGYLEEEANDGTSPWAGTRFDVVGATVAIRDLKAVTESDQVLIQRLVVIAVMGVLIAILRRPLICAYLILSVLFSYYVTIGATELFFGQLYGPTFHGLDWKVPIFLFVILIAVGEDYNIYLVTRVFEEQRRHGQLAGLRIAVARTGGIITSCGVIMAGTFISMTTGTLRGMLELGFALSLGVMLDTCIVRPVLVPAFMAILERNRESSSEATGATGPSSPSRIRKATAVIN